MPKRFTVLSLLTLASCFAPVLSSAQTTEAVAHSARVLSTDLGPRTQLSHHVPVYADTTRLSSDPMPENASFSRLTLMLSRAPEVQAAFDQLTADQQNPSSSRYHQWLTPEQVGELYGPAQSDVDATVAWLKSQNLTVLDVAPNRLFIDFSGPVSAVQKAFSTDFRLFHLANGETRYSLLNEPSIPSALAPVIANVVGLSQIIHRPTLRHGALQSAAGSSQSAMAVSPMLNASSGANYLVAADFATAYDINPVYNAGYTGAGIKVAIAGESRVDANDIADLQTIQGQTVKQPNTIIPTAEGGVDPGYTGGDTYGVCTDPSKCDSGAQDEATLDVNRILGTAPGATADLIISADIDGGNTFGTQGLWIAINHEVNTLRDPILSISFGGCEGLNSLTATQYEDGIFQTAASEGITVFVSSGDSGAASCNAFYTTIPTTACTASSPISPTHGCLQLSINDMCASQYVTCVGGTEFAADAASQSTYWNTSNNSTNRSSIKSYIPEGAWNDIDCSNNNETVATCTTSPYLEHGSGGGGVSVYLARPSWQNGVTTISSTSNYRWVPDVSFTSSADHDGYVTLLEYLGATLSNGSYSFYGFGGTSAAAPSMAAIQALIEQKQNAGAQGNINPTLYTKGIAGSDMFHDVTVASSGVANCAAATPSLCNNSTPTATSVTGGQAGYLVSAGWDAATGWGSLDVNNYLTEIGTTPATFSLSPSPSSLSFTSGSTTACTTSTTTGCITSTITVSGTGTAALSCVVSSSSTSSPYYPPTCSLSSSSVAAGETATLTINSTTSVTVTNAVSGTKTAGVSGWNIAAFALACLLLLPFGRRHTLRSVRYLAVFTLLALGAASITGCGSGGSGGSSGGSSTTTTRSSAGTYTVTVTGASGNSSSSTTVSVSISQ